MAVEPIAPYLEPVRKSITVASPPDRAFATFTGGIARWWPLHQYSINGPRAVTCVVEGRVGGAIYETGEDRQPCPWGRVIAWEPPRRIVFTWHPGRRPDTAQEIEILFTPEGDGTRVDLEHRGWAKLGPDAAATREGYHGGWQAVLAAYAAACGSNEESRNSKEES